MGAGHSGDRGDGAIGRDLSGSETCPGFDGDGRTEIALAELEERVRALSQSDRAALIRQLICELDGPPEPDIDRAWIVEAKRRHQELIEGRVKGMPGAQVLEQAQKPTKQRR